MYKKTNFKIFVLILVALGIVTISLNQGNNFVATQVAKSVK